MNQVNCSVCGKKCVKFGKTKAGTQRWFCKECKTALTHPIDSNSKELQPLQCECIKKKKDEVLSISNMEEAHLNIMIVAVEVSLCLHNLQINKMMRYYTDDKRVLQLAAIVEMLYDVDDVSGEKYAKDHIAIMRRLLRKLKCVEKNSICV